MNKIVLKSVEDKSINFVIKGETEGSYLEARYVSRTDDSFIIYLSSQYGCDLSCRFCHLTQQGQTDATLASFDDYMSQVDQVLEHAVTVMTQTPKNIHVNLMARGDPFLNPQITNRLFYKLIEYKIKQVFPEYKSKVKFKISTIFPKEVDYFSVLKQLSTFVYPNLSEDFISIEVYYSWYSFDEDFRKRWLPKAHNPYKAIYNLFKFMRGYGRIHTSFIENENDNLVVLEEDVRIIQKFAQNYSAGVKFNIVRYNTHDPLKYKETTKLKEIQELFNLLNFNYKLIERVGTDVQASCGMFYK